MIMIIISHQNTRRTVHEADGRVKLMMIMMMIMMINKMCT